ncbi:MAG: VanZ family protein [Acidobacteria bacterium]|nr:VanZ family protein [Acidobacteriota bacterium]
MARTVRTVTISRPTTIALLVFATVVIALITLWASGKAYAKVDPVPFHDLRLLGDKLAEGPVPFPTFVALISPMILNMLLFMPWGFLAFIALDTPARPALQSYLLTILLALGLSFAVEATQYFLPDRVTDVNDVIWNSAGALAGAFFGHLRKRVRVAFE